MAKITALSHDELHGLGTAFTDQVLREVTRVLRSVSRDLTSTATVDDLAVIATLWRKSVDDTLLPHLGAVYRNAVDTVHANTAALVASALIAAPTPQPDSPGTIEPVDATPIAISKVTNVRAEQYLADARNRLVNVGNEIWESARAALLEGMSAGEGVLDLASRLGMVPSTYTARAEVIARTEVQSASNVGSVEQMRAIDVPATKTWIATMDERTRPEHADADGQEVDVNDSFDVDGEALDTPGDPNGSAGNIINCRCTVSFTIPDDQVPDLSAEGDISEPDLTGLLAAATPAHTGAMIALVPSAADLDRLAFDGGEPRDELHLTLLFLGEAASHTPEMRQSVIANVASLFGTSGPLTANGFGVDYWNPTSDTPAWVLAVGDDAADLVDLDDMQERAQQAINACGCEIPEQHTPWAPHVCLAYSTDTTLMEQLVDRCGPITFDTVRVAFGDDVSDMALSDQAVSLAAIEGLGDDMTATVTDLGGKPSEGTKKDKRLRENPPIKKKTAGTTDPVSLAPADSSTVPQWRGVLTVEGVPTGDGREFAPDSLTWQDSPDAAPMILQWQKESSHGGDHDVTVAVGRIDRAWRDGKLIMGEGRFDTHTDAVEAHRRMEAGMLNGTSINADDITDADVEYVYPEGDADSQEDGDWIELLFQRPEKTIFHAGRIRATTLCDIPAFVEAKLSIVDGSAAPSAAAADSSHSTDTSDDEWDAALHESRLPATMTEEVAAAAYASIDEGVEEDAIAREHAHFIHHEIAEDGTPGAASLAACRSDIALLHDADLPDSSKRAIHAHLARHLRDAGQEVSPFEPQHSLVAGGFVDTFRPPAAWFRDPGLTVPTPIMITDQGRVYGLATEWAECHLGYMNECVLPPRDDDFSRFMTGEQPLDDGTVAAVGVITAGIGHAPLSYGANKAAEHYDNTEAMVAYVRTGNCKLGIWVAGAVLPWAQEARVSALRASGQVSPDWRRIGGKLRMHGLLTVNISGYQISKPSIRQLVAGGQVRALIASGFTSVKRPAESKLDLDGRALKLISDQLAKRVHPEG